MRSFVGDSKKTTEIIQAIVSSKSQVRTYREPDSCFTWAKKKLKLIDIDIGDKPTDVFASVTTLYTG
jgi:hypothetical protein